jgi:excisionase family DNA binding protein
VTVKEAAQLIRRSERTIYRWLEEGFLPAKKVKDGWLIKPEDLLNLLH